MNFLRKLEQKIGRFAISGLTRYIIITYVIGYVLAIFEQLYGYNILGFLTLNPEAIIHGQIWRLVTWVLCPPGSLNIFTILVLFCYYQLGTMLERTWGTFLYNIYIFMGLICTVIGAFLIMLLPYGRLIYSAAWASGVQIYSTYYVSLSIFLGFALTYPEQTMLVYMIIPVKIKYLAVADLALLTYQLIITFRRSTASGIITLVMIVSSLAGTLIYYLLTRKGKWNYGSTSRRQHQKRHKEFKQAVSRSQVDGSGKISRHKCAVCGQTELSNPDLEFRFCSKCNGNYEYCQNHLFTHEHIK
ncbi:MAG: hypothetical protein Q4B03_03230 [Lachnospiraceae bacterium]|nr:hypothetical protein [Lachnospiraceae bacterium]